MSRYFLELAYKGTNYCGWQIQQNAVTVQQRLNESLTTLCEEKIETLGCGRTDTGVHALEFYAHFDTANQVTDVHKFIYQLNSLLPLDIAAYGLIPVDKKAHARFDATSRTYKYYLTQRKNPFLRESAWYWRSKPDFELMNEAAKLLLPHTAYLCFSKQGSDNENNLCTVTAAQWQMTDEFTHVFTITANRFLRGMVRAIVGTLMEVGTGKITIADFKNILTSGTRSDAGAAVPAHGLFLTHIAYPFINNEKEKLNPLYKLK